MRRTTVLAAVMAMAGCGGGPREGRSYALESPATLSVDYPGGRAEVVLGDGSIVRVLGSESERGRRWLKVHVERGTGPGRSHEGRTGYVPADRLRGPETQAP